MATFNSMIVTNGGKVIYAKAMAGKTIAFSKVSFGSGNPSSQSAAVALTQLVDEKIVGSIESIDTTTTAGVAIVTTTVNNSTLTEPLGIKEIGIFCKDPDTQAEVMYAYCYSPTDIDVIPSSTSGTVSWKMRVNLEISNATGEPTTQTDLIQFTPSVTATAADGLTVFLSNVLASGKYTQKGNILTAFIEITGKLTNMGSAESGLSSITISVPKAASMNCEVLGSMTVTNTAGAAVIVGVTGEIASGSSNIAVDYFGAQNGNFRLLMPICYVV